MATDLIYIPTFRARQQELLVLQSFDFGNRIYPMLEIVKEHDRKRADDKQLPFSEIYGGIIEKISAQKVFVDMPLYLRKRASMKSESLAFSLSVISNRDKRTQYMNSLSDHKNIIIPVISSYSHTNDKETGTIKLQVEDLRSNYDSIAFRTQYNHFMEDWDEIEACATPDDYVIMDLDDVPPYPSSSLRRLVDRWKTFNTCPKVVLRSAINTDVTWVGLSHGEVAYDIDNGLSETFKAMFHADVFGDYVGIKKDELTSGGRISPGFLLYNAVNNEFVGFKGTVKYLDQFEKTIVPDVLASGAAQDMKESDLPYLTDNKGWETLLDISKGKESGKSQAKFKRISMDHYLHCIKVKILHHKIG